MHTNTSVTTDTSGAVTSRTRYKAFGEVLLTSNQETTGTLNTEHKFTGQIFDTGTDLYFYNARYYDRTLRRFTQADDVEPDRDNPQSLNRYSYVFNNPLRYNDPSGQVANDPSDDPGISEDDIPKNILGVDDDWWLCILFCDHTQNIRDMLASQLNGSTGGGGSPNVPASVKVPNTLDSDNDPAEFRLPPILRGFFKLGPKLPKFPKFTDDPALPPSGGGWKWMGSKEKGAWWRPKTDEYWRYDGTHHKKPHYDYRAPDGSEWRVFKDKVEYKHGGPPGKYGGVAKA